MSEFTRLRRVGQVVFLLGLLGWGLGISYVEAGRTTPAIVVFVAGTLGMGAGLYVIYREAGREPDDRGD